MSAVSESVGRYLSAIHLLTTERDRAAKTGELADWLEISAASVTEMLTTLESQDFVTYEKYRGVELTEQGETEARAVMWKQCVAENFLSEDLDLDGVDLDDISAESVGHALSDEVAMQLRAYINHPCEHQCEAPQNEFSECREDVIGK